MKNPKWTRDELILALDLYFRCPPTKTNKDHPEIVALSDLLNSLPIHPQKTEYEKFRNPNGVYMKLCDFLRFDPEYTGQGLKAGGKLEEDIWGEFASDKEKLRLVCNAIISTSTEIQRPTDIEVELDKDNDEFEEGRILTKLHNYRERVPSICKKKKTDTLNSKGKLGCEACGFDFYIFYGKLGEGFAECHHTKPVSELKPGETTKLTDLSILCANCHRMIHKSKPMMTVEAMKRLITMTAKK